MEGDRGLLGAPADAEALAWHKRLLSGDPIASEQISAAFLEPLLGYLNRRFPAYPDHLREDAVVDALIGYLERPERYDPTRAPLARYLMLACAGDLLNLAERARRRQGREISLDLARERVGFDLPDRNWSYEGSAVEAELVAREGLAELWQAILAETRDEAERIAIRLLMAGARDTAVYAQALGLAGLPAAAQREQVDRLKERLRRRCQRRLARHRRAAETTPPMRSSR